jgi:hypothetical protein
LNRPTVSEGSAIDQGGRWFGRLFHSLYQETVECSSLIYPAEDIMRPDMSEDVRAILARFPGPVVIEPTELRRFINMGVAMLLVASAIVYIAQHASVGGTAVGLAVVGLAWLIVFGKNSLMLDRDGFVNCTTFVIIRRRWRDVRDFRSWTIRTTLMITYDHLATKESAFARRINRAMNSGNSSFVWSFGLSGPEAVALMNAWRERALQVEQQGQTIG